MIKVISLLKEMKKEEQLWIDEMPWAFTKETIKDTKDLILQLTEAIKILTNEPKVVRNNEDEKEVCFICNGKGSYIYEQEVYECYYCK